MNRQQALHIMGISEEEDAVYLRTRYRQLMKQYHPDSPEAGRDDLIIAQQLTEAYRILKAELSMSPGKAVRDWGLKENPQAFTKRTVFLEDFLFGHDISAETGIRGRFYWDPEIETFSSLLKSTGMETVRILENSGASFTQQDRAKLLHLLLQEFIDPCESLKAYISMGKVKTKDRVCLIPCHLKLLSGREKAFARNEKMSRNVELEIFAEGSRLLAADQAGACGVVHFNENEFYYIITPLILRNEASARLFLEKGRTHLGGKLCLMPDQDAGTDVTEKINQEIRRMLER